MAIKKTILSAIAALAFSALYLTPNDDELANHVEQLKQERRDYVTAQARQHAAYRDFYKMEIEHVPSSIFAQR